MLGVCVGESVDDSYGRDVRRGVPSADRAADSEIRATRHAGADFRVLVIGAGVSGIIAAHQLQADGHRHI